MQATDTYNKVTAITSMFIAFGYKIVNLLKIQDLNSNFKSKSSGKEYWENLLNHIYINKKDYFINSLKIFLSAVAIKTSFNRYKNLKSSNLAIYCSLLTWAKISSELLNATYEDYDNFSKLDVIVSLLFTILAGESFYNLYKKIV